MDSPIVVYHGATDMGNVRSNNEDVFAICEQYHYCLVADGMGGAAAGEVASRLFSETAQVVFAGHDGQSEEETIERVQTTFIQANEKILAHVKDNPGDHGMGCTAELIAFSQGKFIIGHVGDSRSYRLRNDMLKLLTKDHSLVQEQIDQGIITPQEAKQHAMRNVILRAVGVNDNLPVDILKGRQEPGDLFLLCSDGLTDLVSDADILATLFKESGLDEKADSLILQAKEAGGKDNVTVALAAIN